MVFKPIHHPFAKNPPASQNASPLAPRPFAPRQPVAEASPGTTPPSLAQRTATFTIYPASQEAGLARKVRSGDVVIQAKWVKGPGPLLKWDIPRGGLTWWFNQEDQTMARTPASVDTLSSEEAQKLEWKPHKQWQAEWLDTFDPDAGVAPKFTYQELLSKGKIRWEELTKMGAGVLDPETQAARDWFFENYYSTRARKDDEDTSVGSLYNASPKSHKYQTAKQRGEYTARYNVEEGNMALANTYALGGGGETYYNPKTRKEERMSASEILFQQWRMAAKVQGKKQPLLKKKEETVAGDALLMVKLIRATLEVPRTDDVTFSPGDDGFFAMLATPNVTAAIFLIRDHGVELGIKTITSIVVKKNIHIEVHFG
jgi:hypothetical protein